jgi:hypothetical protein
MDTLEHEWYWVAAGRGKWSQAGVPHRGWQCIDIEDLGEPQVTCEMCESQTIRYVHYMEHPNYPQVLEVGCICAGHMEGDVAAARTRESFMHSRAGKRKRWLTRKWRMSAKGNSWLRADGYRITVYERGGGWATTVSAEDNSLVQHSRRNYKTQEQAKLAAFDHITRLEAGNASQGTAQ